MAGLEPEISSLNALQSATDYAEPHGRPCDAVNSCRHPERAVSSQAANSRR